MKIMCTLRLPAEEIWISIDKTQKYNFRMTQYLKAELSTEEDPI